jgi:hypothetical protein
MKTRNLERLAVGSVLVVVLLRLAPVCEAQMLWLNAGQGVTLGTPPAIATWANQGSSGAALDVSNSDTATQPLLVSSDPTANSQNTVQFSPGNFLDVATAGANLFSGADSTVFIVQKDNTPDPSGNSLNWHTPDGLNYLSMNAANNNLIVFDSGKSSDFIQADISSQPNFYGQWHVITGVRNGLPGRSTLMGRIWPRLAASRQAQPISPQRGP